jgi:hypothetical protein
LHAHGQRGTVLCVYVPLKHPLPRRPRSSLLLLLTLTLALDLLDSTGVQVGTAHALPARYIRRISHDFRSPEVPMGLVVVFVGEKVVGFSVGLSVCNASVRDGRIIEKVELRQVMSSRVRSGQYSSSIENR